MGVSFPTSKRYFVTFRNSDTGLTPTFTYYKRTDTFAGVTAPSITELQNGTYYFDVTFALDTSPDIIFQIDGGLSIPTEEIRFQTGMVSPKDLFVDEPSSVSTTTISNGITSIKGGSNIDLTQVYTRLGAPAGASMSADIASIKGDSSTINTNTANLGTLLTRALGLMHENSVMDQTTFDPSNNLTSARLRLYNTKANAVAAGATGLLYTYTITASYTGENVQTYTVVREGS